jgi:valyl-tRNA synthetase
LTAYELGVAAQKIYDFIWDSYCDWYIELTKTRITGGSEEQKIAAQQVLCYVLTDTLKLLHPFMPFLTEEIYQALPHEGEFLMTSAWPVRREELNFPQEESAMEALMDLIRGVRARRAEMNVPPSRKAKLLIVSKSGDIFRQGEAFLKRLAWSDEIELAAEPPADLRGHGFRRDARGKGIYTAFSARGPGAGTAAHREGEEQGGRGVQTRRAEAEQSRFHRESSRTGGGSRARTA